MQPKVGIFISGGGSNMVRLVEEMAAGTIKARPAFVFSNVPDAGGLAKAEALGVPTVVVDHTEHGKNRESFEAALFDAVTPFEADIFALAGFMRILTPSFFDGFSGPILNIHPSLLPKYKGLHTHQRAIDAGDAEAGCSIHYVTAELDGGPVIKQARVPILPDDTADTLAARVLVEEHKLYPSVLAEVALNFRDG